VYDAFCEAGGNFIDTANLYTNGTSESFLGEFMEGHRKGMVQVLYTDISDAPAWWIAQANTLAHLRGWSPFVGLQIEYSLIERTVERELIPMAKTLNLGVTAWSPLARGVLTGKYHAHASSEASAGPGRLNNDMAKDFMPERERTERIVAALKTVSDETGRSIAQVALAWHRYRPVPVIPIIGARKLSQFQDKLASFDLTLSADHLTTLDEASRIELGFPYDMYAKAMPRAVCYGGLRDQIRA
jgi:aryl-alcohol dehydrogenase-like predicted oxidoreductase